MSYDALGVSDAMLDSLSMQLREAEARKFDAERAHQVSAFISHTTNNHPPASTLDQDVCLLHVLMQFRASVGCLR